jgi:peptide/nickel transport system substrate-binding protein
MLRLLKYAFLASAFIAVSPGVMAATPSSTLVIGKQIDDIISLDPGQDYEFSGVEVDANLYDRIMRFEPTDINKLVPGVAESVDVSTDGKTFTFKIRAGQKFASGNPVTAEDAAWSLQRVIKLQKTPVFLLSQLGWTPDNVDTMVTAPDASTLKVTITANYAPTLVYALLGSIVGSVIDEKTAMAHVANGDFGNAWLTHNSAGSGAYVLKSWTPDQSVVLEGNPNYRGGAPKLSRVVLQHIPDASAQRLALEKGDIDIADNLTPDQVTALGDNKDIKVSTVPQATLLYVGLNQKMKELTDPRVRQALRYLVDYDGMANSFLKGADQVHQSFWASGFWASYDTNPYKLDVAKAKDLLTQAGYPNGFSIDLDAPNVAPYTNIAQSLQSTMAQAGIKVNIIPAEQKPLLTKYRARQHQMLLVYWGPDYMDPHTNADGFITNTDNSDGAAAHPLAWRNTWQDAGMNAGVAAAASERDEDKRKQDYIDLQKQLLDVGPYIIMFQSISQRADRSNVQGYVQGPSSDVVYYNLTTK